VAGPIVLCRYEIAFVHSSADLAIVNVLTSCNVEYSKDLPDLSSRVD